MFVGAAGEQVVLFAAVARRAIDVLLVPRILLNLFDVRMLPRIQALRLLNQRTQAFVRAGEPAERRVRIGCWPTRGIFEGVSSWVIAITDVKEAGPCRQEIISARQTR